MLDALAGGGAYFFRTLSDAVGSTDDAGPRRRRCGTWSGPGASPTTPSRRCGPCSPAAAPRTSRAGPAPRATRYCRPAAARWARLSGRRPGRAGPRCRPAAVRPPRPGAGRCCPPAEPDADRARLRHRRGPARPLRRGDPRARSSPRACRAASPASTGCWPPPRRPAGCAAATSSRASAPRSSPPPAPSTGSAPEPPAARAATTTGPAGPATAPGRPGASRATDRAERWSLAAADPANAYGAALPWPRAATARAAGQPPAGPQGRARWSCSSTASWSLYVERGGKTLLSWTDDAGAAAGRGRRARPRRPRGRPRPAHRREGRRRLASWAPTIPSPPPWPRPGSTPPRAACGCAGDR